MNRAVDWFLVGSILILFGFSVFFLNSVASELFPQYLIFVFASFIVFSIFAVLGLDILSVFSKHLYIASIILLLLPVIIGQVTRGTVRWIPLGSLSFQPSEIVRPFVLLFFANYFSHSQNTTLFGLIKGLILLLPVTVLILIQPSLGVTVVTSLGVLGVILASQVEKKYLLIALASLVLISPLIYTALAPYQKQRINIFLNPSQDPLGAGYNSIQSMFAVGSGQI